MRVVIDANVFISYLLAPQRPSPNAAIVRAAILGGFTLLLPQALMQELMASASAKPYLARRIEATDLTELAGILESVAEVVPGSPSPFPP